MTGTQLGAAVIPFVARDRSWVYAQFVVTGRADTWIAVPGWNSASVQFRQTFPLVALEWSAVSGDAGVRLGWHPAPRTYLLRVGPPERTDLGSDILVHTGGPGWERLHFTHRQHPGADLSRGAARQLAAVRMVDALRELATAWSTWPQDQDEVVDAAVSMARLADRWDVAAEIIRHRKAPGRLAASRILDLARSPRQDRGQDTYGRHRRPDDPGPLRGPAAARADGSAAFGRAEPGDPAPPRAERSSRSVPLPPPARLRDDPTSMTTEMEAIGDEIQKRRSIDDTLSRFSAVHDELKAEERDRKTSRRKGLPWQAEADDELDRLDDFLFDEEPDEQPRTRRKAAASRPRRRRRAAKGDTEPLSRPKPQDEPPPDAPVVNTGFAPTTSDWKPCSPDATLQAGTPYLFWLSVEPPLQRSIELEPTALPGSFPESADIAVVLFTFPGEIELDDGDAVGVLRMGPGGTARVLRQAHPPTGSWPSDKLAFSVRMPRRPGTARLRCNLYWNHLLIQSRLVEVAVTRRPRQRELALRSVLDFRIADPAATLARQNSAGFAASLQMDDDGEGTHGLRVFADNHGRPVRAEATITGSDITNQIGLARSALHRVAWGEDSDWREGLRYRHHEPASYEQLANDLVSLAVNGFRLYHLLVRSLAVASSRNVYEMAGELRSTMSRPSYVQIALRRAAQHVLPAAMLYDLPLDTQADEIRVCAEFERAAAGAQVHAARCFQGTCAQALEPDDTVVCPGGFWGYRHALGLPVSIGTAAALPAHLDARTGARVTGGVYRDFQLVDEHQTALSTLLPGMRVKLADTRPDTLRELRGAQPHLVYFYCHGGVAHSVPYLRVGTGSSGPVITPDNLFNSRIRWDSHRPLVFLNGCRTTGLYPENAIDFVSFFVQDAWACGVIGTEITVFEPLATVFAEECLRNFVTHGLPIGLAVRQARIAMLARHNPLGLAYVPFVSPVIHFLRNHDFGWFSTPPAPAASR